MYAAFFFPRPSAQAKNLATFTFLYSTTNPEKTTGWIATSYRPRALWDPFYTIQFPTCPKNARSYFFLARFGRAAEDETGAEELSLAALSFASAKAPHSAFFGGDKQDESSSNSVRRVRGTGEAKWQGCRAQRLRQQGSGRSPF